MGTSSPAPSIETGPTKDGTAPPKQNLRGINKPKCFQCGNVARSRCPYQSCKSCCAKAQNPCHIHVLKLNVTFPDKPTLSSCPLEKPSTNACPSGASLQLSSLQQFSSNYAQFNGTQVSLRATRPLSWKDAAAINAWRFSKLNEYNDQNIETENEAFDRYMQNVSLLEEAFFVNSSLEGLSLDGLQIPDSAALTSEDGSQKFILGMKAKLKSNVAQTDRCRQRIRDLLDRGLWKLQKCEFEESESIDMVDANGERELRRPKKKGKWWAERTTAINDLIDTLNKTQSAEELKDCLQLKAQLFNWNKVASGKSDFHQSKGAQMYLEKNDKDASLPSQEIDLEMSTSSYSLPKLCNTVEINQEMLSGIDVQFSSLDQIAAL